MEVAGQERRGWPGVWPAGLVGVAGLRFFFPPLACVSRRDCRVGTQSWPVGEGCGKTNGGEECHGEAVISCGDAAEVFETVAGARDDIAALVGALVVADGFLRLERPGITGLILRFLKKARNALLS